MQNQNQQDENKKTFPRAVYKRGSGKAIDDSGKYEAESRIVKNQDELTSLGADWVATPAEAATSGANSSTGTDARRGVGTTNEGDDKHDDKHHKKAK